jgi:putative SbcD/Mre11-related phosphoesterase
MEAVERSRGARKVPPIDFLSTHILAPGLHLDARRILWMPEERALVAADLHLGYAWAHRHAGQLMPVTAPDDAVERLAALAAEFSARQVVLLGDIVHRAVPVPSLREELAMLAARLAGRRVRWIVGNHDRDLETLLPEVMLESEITLGAHRLTHGAEETAPPHASHASHASHAGQAGGWLVIGHEHPAIHLHDGIATGVKVPCFLAGARVLILPAFSQWAAGANVRNGHFLSAIANGTRFTHAFALIAGRILPVNALSCRRPSAIIMCKTGVRLRLMTGESRSREDWVTHVPVRTSGFGTNRRHG